MRFTDFYTTIPKVLRQRGYVSACIGKYGVGSGQPDVDDAQWRRAWAWPPRRWITHLISSRRGSWSSLRTAASGPSSSTTARPCPTPTTRARTKAAAIEAALDRNYHTESLDNRKVLIDPRQPEHNVYGDRHVAERAGTIRTFLQAVPDSVEAHAADVREMVETSLIQWRQAEP